MGKTLLLAYMQEKKIGRGEDSDPILYENSDYILLGVFDGMGGAGGAECESDFSHDGIDMTKAYIGSRIVRDAIDKAVCETPQIIFENDFTERLSDIQ